MIPTEVESLQSQLTDSQLEVEEFFVILLSTYDLDLCKECFQDMFSNFVFIWQLKYILFLFWAYFESLCRSI